MENKYRVTFSPNGLEPFTWECKSLERGLQIADAIADFDLGRGFDSSCAKVIHSYKAYRRSHSINHPDLIQFSTASVDEKDENGQWWVVSESLNKREFEVGEMPAFDNESEYFDLPTEDDMFLTKDEKQMREYLDSIDEEF